MLDSPETADGVRRDSTFAPMEKLWGRLDVVLVGASSLTQETTLGSSGVFSRDELEGMRGAGGVCAMNFLVLDAGGAVIDHPTALRIINLPIERLKSAPHVVVVAAGPDKVEPIRVALKSGLVSTLVSDVATGRGLIS